uniref:Uncharacterized protein n=1 Tax=Nelumbo nucifera TaxID=4432 RepID=A0A822YRU1_NELNU|nr:TPA_asm: hypothetical protein HUJ06_010779 [Nelumbo nucifera]
MPALMEAQKGQISEGGEFTLNIPLPPVDPTSSNQQLQDSAVDRKRKPESDLEPNMEITESLFTGTTIAHLRLKKMAILKTLNQQMSVGTSSFFVVAKVAGREMPPQPR